MHSSLIMGRSASNQKQALDEMQRIRLEWFVK